MRMKQCIGLLAVGIALLFGSCKDNTYTIPDGVNSLTNDCLKRSLGPNMVGGSIEFAYAMAMPYGSGHLVSASVEASIAGADSTYLEHRSFHTGDSGEDVGVEIGSPSVNDGGTTTVTFTKDTVAATLRYYYMIPEEARGKQVSFRFSATDSNGKEVSYDMGPYNVENMDMKLDIELKNNSFFSIEDMAAYTATEAAAIPEKIDFVYLHRVQRGGAFNHAFVSPTAANASAGYLPNITLPAGIEKSTKFYESYSSCDQQLARDEYGVFVTDRDLSEFDFSIYSDYSINVVQKNGFWVETADGRYRAYIYVNEATENRAGMIISMKRLKMK